MEQGKEEICLKEKEHTFTSGVDTGLIAMFLKMTPEERLRSNDNAINTITELRNAAGWKQSANRQS
ncbi:MAG: hypothetical protein AB7S75_24850 [Desulfococcaceae bacterium]